MNKVTISKYSEMKNIAMVVSSALQQLNEKCLWFLLFFIDTEVYIVSIIGIVFNDYLHHTFYASLHPFSNEKT